MATEYSKETGYDTVLDVDAERLAKVYAKAFLAAATGRSQSGGPNEQEAVDQLRAVVTEIVDKFPNFAEAISSSFLSHEERAALIDKVLKGRIDDVVVNTLKVMSAHNRLGVLRTVARQAQELYNEQCGRVHVKVTSPTGLTDDLLADLGNALKSRFGVEPILEQRIDEEMIAGVKIQLADTVYDGSVRTVFAKARSAMITRAIDRIENNPGQFLSEAGTDSTDQ